MHKETTNHHECREPENAPFSSPTHARRKSMYQTEKSLAAARTESQKQQVTEAPNGSQESETHGMAYSPTQAATPLPDSDLVSSSTMSLMMSSDELSDEHILQDIYEYINEEMDPSGQHQASWCFQHADMRPPITPESLAELDMPRIINNPRLRHDVNFDRELHFRPNFDGSKGRQKILQADHYWKALEAELVMQKLVLVRKAQSCENEAYWDRVLSASLVRLPKIFAAIRDILKTLVPDYDQNSVTERLDVNLIMQQIQNGVCDLIDLGNWLAKVLKKHCAPMRDLLVDSMQKEIRQGATEGKHEKLVSGLRQVMNILEAMKLDVANHQIRHMRALLIDDTIHFQRRFNLHRIAIGKISVPESKDWLQDVFDDRGSPLEALTSGLIRDILLNDSASMCPETFYLDSVRLQALRTELHTSVYHAICRDVLEEIAPPTVGAMDLLRAEEMLHGSVSAIVGMEGLFMDRLDNIAVEIVRVLLVIEGRNAPFDLDLLNMTEQTLRDSFRTESGAFRMHAQTLMNNLVPKVQARVREHARLSAIDLQDILVPLAAPQRSSTGFGAVLEPVPGEVPAPIDADEDIIRRFTHILALHWQTTSDLVYLAAEYPIDRDEDSVSENGSESTMVQSAQGSPTIPVARAVYASGRRWRPVGETVADVPSALPTSAASAEGSAESKPEADNEQQQSEDVPEASQQQRQPA